MRVRLSPMGWLLLVLLLASIVILPWKRLDTAVLDGFARAMAPPATQDSVLILVDEASAQRLSGRFGPAQTWTARTWLTLAKQAQRLGVRHLILDAYVKQADPSVMNQAGQFHSDLVVGRAVTKHGLSPSWGPVYGLVNTPPDDDGILRNYPLFMAGQPALAVAAAQQQHQQQQARFPLEAIRLRWPQLRHLSETGLTVSHSVIPAWWLFDPGKAALVQATAHGKVAFLGAAAPNAGLGADIRRTPLSMAHVGVDIHAIAYDALVQGNWLRTLPLLFQLLVCLALLWGGSWLASRLEKLPNAIFLFVAGLTVWGWLGVGAWQCGWVLPVATGGVSALAGFAGGLLWRLLLREAQTKRLAQVLGHLVSPTVLAELQRRKLSMASLDLSRREITSILVDMRGFVAFSHTQPSERVAAMLNRFYGVVEDVVFSHGGTLDKFLGDGVLAFFGAPLDDPHHAAHALAAAQAISQVLTAEGIPHGVTLATGWAWVGFVGPSRKREYTAIGDCVNLTARLQDESKRHKVAMVVDASTRQALEKDLAEALAAQNAEEAAQAAGAPEAALQWLSLGETQVRGFRSMTTLYTLGQGSSP